MSIENEPRISPKCQEKGFKWNYTTLYIGIFIVIIGATVFALWLTPVYNTNVTNYVINLVVVIIILAVGSVLMILSGTIGSQTEKNCLKNEK